MGWDGMWWGDHVFTGICCFAIILGLLFFFVCSKCVQAVANQFEVAAELIDVRKVQRLVALYSLWR